MSYLPRTIGLALLLAACSRSEAPPDSKGAGETHPRPSIRLRTKTSPPMESFRSVFASNP